MVGLFIGWLIGWVGWLLAWVGLGFVAGLDWFGSVWVGLGGSGWLVDSLGCLVGLVSCLVGLGWVAGLGWVGLGRVGLGWFGWVWLVGWLS